MPTEDLDAGVHRLTELVLAEMKESQEAHPRATLDEVEMAVAMHWARVQAKVVEAKARAAPPINTQPEAVRRLLRLVQARGGSVAAQETLVTTLGYLEKRVARMRYAQFRAQGYPIGSGIVESGNRVAVQRRLKGPGMHWARGHIDPLVALTGVECNGRWAEAGPQFQHWQRQQRQAARAQRRGGRAARHSAPATPPPVAAAPVQGPSQPRPAATVRPGRSRRSPSGGRSPLAPHGHWAPTLRVARCKNLERTPRQRPRLPSQKARPLA